MSPSPNIGRWPEALKRPAARAPARSADQIEHAWFILDDDGRQEYLPSVGGKLAAVAVAITPTLSVESYCVQAMHAEESLTPADEAFLRRWETMLQTNLTHLGRLHEVGVTIVAGTDAVQGDPLADIGALCDLLVIQAGAVQVGRTAEALATAAAR